MKHFVTLPYLLSMYLSSSGRGFLPLVSWDQAVTPVYIVLTAACVIQEKRSVHGCVYTHPWECMIHIRGPNSLFKWQNVHRAPAERVEKNITFNDILCQSSVNIRQSTQTPTGICSGKVKHMCAEENSTLLVPLVHDVVIIFGLWESEVGCKACPSGRELLWGNVW